MKGAHIYKFHRTVANKTPSPCPCNHLLGARQRKQAKKVNLPVSSFNFNVNGLNYSIKSIEQLHGEEKKKRPNYVLLQETHFSFKDACILKVKGCEKDVS